MSYANVAATFKIIVALAFLTAASVADGTLFTEPTVLEVTLTGPLTSTLREREEESEHPLSCGSGLSMLSRQLANLM